MTIVANSTGAYFQRSLGQMGDLRSAIERLQTQIATGERLARSSDDPVAASRLRALARDERLSAVNERNADRLVQDLTSTSEQLTGVSGLFVRGRELAIAAANDTLDADAREAIAVEIEQLAGEFLARANSRSIYGEPLFSGQSSSTPYRANAGGGLIYSGTADAGSLTIADGVTLERGLTGPEAFDFLGPGGSSNGYVLLTGLAADLRGGAADPAAAARQAIAEFDAAIDGNNRAQTILGARLAWIDSVQQNQVEREFLRREEQAELGGTELTDAIAQLQQTLTVLEASQASFARISSLTLFDAI